VALLVSDGVHGVVSLYSVSSQAARRSWTAAPSAPHGSIEVHATHPWATARWCSTPLLLSPSSLIPLLFLSLLL
jgi:hypothetical protein